ncbi:MAG: TIGR02281 family clan AA aspartic protease [Armatimonadota bacterium]
MKLPRGAYVLLVLALLAGAGALFLERIPRGASDPHWHPLEASPQHQPVVTAEVAGGQHLRLVVDTAIRHSQARATVAGQLGLRPKRSLMQLPRNPNTTCVTIDRLNIAPVVFRNLPLLLYRQDPGPSYVSHTPLSRRGINEPSFRLVKSGAEWPVDGAPDGSLGTDALERTAWVLDPELSRCALLPQVSRRELAALQFGDPIPITRASGGLFWLLVNFGGIEQAAVLDTGSSITFITGEMAEALRLKPDGLIEPYSSGFSAERLRRTRIPTIRIGPHTISGPEVAYLEGEGAASPITLGMNVLSQFRMLIDFPNRNLYLAPLTPPGQEKLRLASGESRRLSHH